MKRSLEFAKRVYEGYSAVIGVALLALFICYALDYNRTTAHWPSLLAAVVHMLGILFACLVVVAGVALGGVIFYGLFATAHSDDRQQRRGALFIIAIVMVVLLYEAWKR